MTREAELTLSEERARIGTTTEETGRVRARKTSELHAVEEAVSRGTEHADLEGLPVTGTDSGEIETLPDGSVSIPVFEEQLVVTKKLVVRERVVLRKHTVYEEHLVTAELRREQLTVETEGDVAVVHADDPEAVDLR